LHRSRQA